MLVHSVFFWLKPELSDEQVAEFRAGLESLKDIEAAAEVLVGTPAPTGERPVIDRSYTFGLTVLLPDLAAHNAYQAHELHQEFLRRFASYWDKLLVYDVD